MNDIKSRSVLSCNTHTYNKKSIRLWAQPEALYLTFQHLTI